MNSPLARVRFRAPLRKRAKTIQRGRNKRATRARPDLIIGLIAPMGVDCESVHEALSRHLPPLGYDPQKIKISEILTRYVKLAKPSLLSGATYLERKRILMDAGNIVRHVWGTGNALAALALAEIIRLRHGASTQPARGQAYVIDSLKHPNEIELLKSIYGPAFVPIGVHAPPNIRFENIQGQRTLLKDINPELMLQLTIRDQNEDDKLGQQVRASFELSDFVVDVSRSDASVQIQRFVELLFGNKLRTPTISEYGMALARTAQGRSGSLARQIGAAIIHDDGSIVAIGRNDAAKPLGGQYEESDDPKYPKGRDLKRGIDSSDHFRQEALADVIRLLQEYGIIKGKEDPVNLFKRWYYRRKPDKNPVPFLRRAMIMNTIDYIRAVHAETAALLDAARNGINVKGCILYTTTFPCHDCAKAIVAAGIREVIYWAPYPKSLIKELYDDSIEIDVPSTNPDKVHFHSFVGVAPNRYADFFIMGNRERKDDSGKPDAFRADEATLTLPEHAMPNALIQYIENEMSILSGKRARALTRKLNRQLQTIKRSTVAGASLSVRTAPAKRSRRTAKRH